MDRCDHTDLPTNTCAHCQPAPANTPSKRQPAKCGTRGGYSRHRRLGEPYCEPCRIANTEANRRLAQTGTSQLPATEPAAPPVKTYAPRKLIRPAGPDDWRKQGTCASHPHPDLWHPDGTTGPHLLQAEQAKRICREECPVMQWCQAWALTTREKHGVWGGLDEAERRSRQRGRREGMRGAPRNDLDGRRPQIAHDLYWRHQAGETINALAKDAGLSWRMVEALVAEGRAAA